MDYNAKVDKGVVVKSLSWKIMERMFSQSISLIIQIILARLLQPEDFGTLAIILAIINYSSIFVQSGLSTAIVQKETLDELDVSTCLVASLTIAAFFYIFLFFISPIIADHYNLSGLKFSIRIMSLVIFLNAINSVQTAVLSRRMQFKRLFWRSMIAVPISGAIGIIMAYLKFGIWALVAYNLSNMLIVVIVMSIGSGMKIKFAFSWERAKKIYAFSGKILLTGLISGTHDVIRTMTIGKRYTPNDLAYYDKAYTYSYYVVNIVNSSVSSVLLPAFSRKQTDVVALKGMARRSIKISAFIMFPILFGVAAAANSLVFVLLTEKWASCVPFLMVFSMLRIPGCLMCIDKQVYYALGRSGINLIYEIGLLIMNITVLLIALQISTFAIAIGALIVEILGGFVIFCISSKIYGYSLFERIVDVWHPALNASIMAVCIWSIKYIGFNNYVTLIVQVLVGIFSYLLLAKISKDDNLNYVSNVIKEGLGIC